MSSRDLVITLILLEARKHGLNYWNSNPAPNLSYSQIKKYGLPEGQHGVEAVLYRLFESEILDRRMKSQFSFYVSWVYTKMTRDAHDPIHCASHQSCFNRPDHCKSHKYCQIKPQEWFPEPKAGNLELKSNDRPSLRHFPPSPFPVEMVAKKTPSYRTGDRSEALTSADEILNLAKELLSTDDFDRAIKLSTMLVSSKTVKRTAIEELVELAAPPPKRPMSYAQHEIQFLPRWTRDALRYLGDYVDVVAKHLTYELWKDSAPGNAPLGASIALLETRKALPDSILTWLKTYNSFIYRPAKHDFRLPGGRKLHRFTSQETVLTLFVTLKLVEMLKQYSHCNRELNCHFEAVLQR